MRRIARIPQPSLEKWMSFSDDDKVKDTLVFLCFDIVSAIKASTRLPRERDLERLFIFLGDPPDKEDLTWFSDLDLKFILERFTERFPDPIPAGVRAGAMYANGWGLLFCRADNLPAEDDVALARQALQTEHGQYSSERIWGASREAVVLYGFDCLYNTATTLGCGAALGSPEQASLYDIREAMTGRECSAAAAVAALRDLVPLSGMGLHASAQNANDTHFDLIRLIYKQASSTDDELPTTMIVGQSIDGVGVRKALRTLPRHGALIAVVDTVNQDVYDSLGSIKPFRTFHVKQGDNQYKVLLYRAAGA